MRRVNGEGPEGNCQGGRLGSLQMLIQGILTRPKILGTAFSVGCQVDAKSPKEVSDDIEAGEIESMSINCGPKRSAKLTVFVQFPKSNVSMIPNRMNHSWPSWPNNRNRRKLPL